MEKRMIFHFGTKQIYQLKKLLSIQELGEISYTNLQVKRTVRLYCGLEISG